MTKALSGTGEETMVSCVLGLVGIEAVHALTAEGCCVLASSMSIVNGDEVNVLFLLEIGLLPCIGHEALPLGLSVFVSACGSNGTGLMDSRSGEGGLVRCGLILGGVGS